MYSDGRSEELIGRVISGQRDRVFLVSKVLPNHATRDGLARACEGNLARLGTDYLDLRGLTSRGNCSIFSERRDQPQGRIRLRTESSRGRGSSGKPRQASADYGHLPNWRAYARGRLAVVRNFPALRRARALFYRHGRAAVLLKGLYVEKSAVVRRAPCCFRGKLRKIEEQFDFGLRAAASLSRRRKGNKGADNEETYLCNRCAGSWAHGYRSGTC